MSLLSRILSIRSRLMLMLILVSALSAMVLISIGYQNGKAAISEGTFHQLTGVRAAKQYQIESYFKQMSGIVEILGKNKTVKEALKDFKKGFRRLDDISIEAECSSQLSTHYDLFIEKLKSNMDVKSDISLYYPTSTAACYLQFEYIIDNPNPLGEKHLMLNAKDGSDYTKAHVKHHDYLTDVILKFGFYDIFLIDLERGDIVYTSYKETDFATNLYNGPYRESNLAELARQLRTNRDIDQSSIIDFQPYRPSYGAPASFIGITITEGSETVGALVLQLPVDEINKIMTGSQNWVKDGLGNSGETYLVGDDFMMRSISRFYLEDTLGYTAALMAKGYDQEDVDKMYRIGTTILQQKVKTEGVIEALGGTQSTKSIEDYRGVPVLSAYSPLKINGLNWAILSEIDLAEANIPILNFQKKVFIALCIIILIITFLAMYLASRFVKPIEKLTEGVRKLHDGDFTGRIEIESKDEFGELGKSFNIMIEDIEEQQNTILHQKKENEKLLYNFIPLSIADRLQKGEKNIADPHPNVSLIVIDVVGFSELSNKIKPLESVAILNNIVEVFDTVAEKHQIEKIKTVGDTYFATCGLFNPRYDHAKRMLEFAKELQQSIRQFNINNKLNLSLSIGVHTGEVISGIVGEKKYTYDLWGTTVNEVFSIAPQADKNEILVSNSVYQKLGELYAFEQRAINSKSVDQPVWLFKGKIETT